MPSSPTLSPAQSFRSLSSTATNSNSTSSTRSSSPAPAASHSHSGAPPPPQHPALSQHPLPPPGHPASASASRAQQPPPPPPRHPTQQPQPQVQTGTTYTPYVPRSRRNTPGGAATGPVRSNTGPTPASAVASSIRGGVTSFLAGERSLSGSPESSRPSSPSVASFPAQQGQQGQQQPPLPARSHTLQMQTQTVGMRPLSTREGVANAGPSQALLDKVRALDKLPRLGELRTLDLRGNELRVGTDFFSV
jgi:protein phosphatase 1 regulatory subunit 37